MNIQPTDRQPTHPWIEYDAWELPDELWTAVAAILPPEPAKPRGGRARTVDPRRTVQGIFYVLRTGCQWQACPRAFGAPSTIYYYFRLWQRASVFGQVWANTVAVNTDRVGLDVDWQSLDVSMMNAPLAGRRRGRIRRIVGRRGASAAC